MLWAAGNCPLSKTPGAGPGGGLFNLDEWRAGAAGHVLWQFAVPLADRFQLQHFRVFAKRLGAQRDGVCFCLCFHGDCFGFCLGAQHVGFRFTARRLNGFLRFGFGLGDLVLAQQRFLCGLDLGVDGVGNGTAAAATKLATARTITLTGAVTGSATFDGSACAT